MRYCRRCAAIAVADATTTSGNPHQYSGTFSANMSKARAFEAFPKWFRACADDIYKRRSIHGSRGASFEAEFNRAANTTMPALQHISLPQIVSTRRAECTLVHVSRAEICMCSLSMMRIRFEVGLSLPLSLSLSLLCMYPDHAYDDSEKLCTHTQTYARWTRRVSSATKRMG